MFATILLAAVVTFRGLVLHHDAAGRNERVVAAIVDVWKAGEDNASTTVTAYDGTFSFGGVVPRQYGIRISNGESATYGTIEVAGTSTASPRTFFLLDPGCWAAYGRVYDRLTAEPLTGATITYLGEATTDADGDYYIDWGCASGPGFRFHNSFFYGASALGYRPVSFFGGRAENVGGIRIQDFSLLPIQRDPQERTRGKH